MARLGWLLAPGSLGAKRPLPVTRWKPRHRDAALAVHGENAEGVGQRDAQGFLEFGEYAAHLYLPLSEEEREGLPAPA